MSALVPFLEDRSRQSMQYLRSFTFNLQIETEKQAYRQNAWAQAFSALPQFPGLVIKELDICINDEEMRYAFSLKLHTKIMQWVHTLGENITSLERLGIHIDYTCVDSPWDEDVAAEGKMQEELWAFLAPKMLKTLHDEPHDMESLKKRRIYDTRDERYDYISHEEGD